MQAFFFWGGGKGVVFVCARQKENTVRSVQFLAETVESGNKYRDVTSTAYSKDVELFRNGSVHEFYRLKELITLEQANISVVEKKKNLYEQNFSETSMVHGMRLTGRVLQMSLVISMQFF